MTTGTIETLADLPFHVSGRYPKPALVGRCTPEGQQHSASREFFEQIRDLSLGLSSLGIEPGSRVALLCESRPEWLIADLAIATASAVSVPVYPTLPPNQVEYILGDAGAAVAIASDEAQAEKVRAAWPRLPALRALVIIDPTGDASAAEQETTLRAVQQQGHQRLMHEDGLGREYKETASALRPDQLATIIYTSGTTGDPKGVMLTHGAIVANVIDSDTMAQVTEDDEALSFLPLSHALERTVVYMYLFKGVTITFAESLETVARDMQQVRPTVMTGVPPDRSGVRSDMGDRDDGERIARAAATHAVGPGGRAGARDGEAGRPGPGACDTADVAAGRPPRVIQDPRAHGWSVAVCRVWRSAVVGIGR